MSGFLRNQRYKINPSGGSTYHQLAKKYQPTLWRPFINQLNHWLLEWPVQNTKRLIIVGASGGYCLSDEFLSQFSHIYCIDPDPLAERHFCNQHQALLSSVRIQWDQRDYFGIHRPELDFQFLQKPPFDTDACILFSNIFGQLPLLNRTAFSDSKKLQSYHSQLHRFLSHRLWSSFHDLYSSPCRLPDFDDSQLNQLAALPAGANTHSCLSQIFSMAGTANIEVTDHLTNSLFQFASRRRYFSWPLKPLQFHIIEAVSN